MQTKNCEKCNKEFTKKWPYQIKKARFCSHKCANEVMWNNHEFTEEHKQKLQEGRKKFVYTQEIKEKMSQIKKEQFENGIEPWNKGKINVYSEEQLARMSEANKKKAQSGENHPNWKGGLSVIFVRKQRLRENGGSHTNGEWETLKAQYNHTCPCCKKKEPEIKLSQDHIIPLAKGGSDNIENIQPLCRSCNAKKHTTIIRYELTEK